jgi:hypothetical protein
MSMALDDVCKELKLGARGNRRVAMNDAQRYRMNDAQRYRMNAAQCLSAAERCEQPHRRPALAMAEAWLSLARHEEAMDGLLAIWAEGEATHDRRGGVATTLWR